MIILMYVDFVLQLWFWVRPLGNTPQTDRKITWNIVLSVSCDMQQLVVKQRGEVSFIFDIWHSSHTRKTSFFFLNKLLISENSIKAVLN